MTNVGSTIKTIVAEYETHGAERLTSKKKKVRSKVQPGQNEKYFTVTVRTVLFRFGGIVQWPHH